jgi:hypothetical protein
MKKMTREQTMSKSSNLSFFTKHLKFIQNLEIGMSKTSNKAKKRARALDNAKSKK